MAEKLPGESLALEQASELIAREGAQALHIQDDDEYTDGLIAGATHASAGDLDSELGELSKDASVSVVCLDGERSGDVAAELRSRGYEAASMEGGMDAWSSDKLPLQPAGDHEYEGPRRPGPLGQ